MASLTFEASKEGISVSDIANFEQEVGIKLPDAYKAHLLKHNGGIPSKDLFLSECGDEVGVSCFYSLKHGKARLEEVVKALKIDNDHLPANLFPIADDGGGNQICISIGGHDNGAIYIFYNDMGGEVIKLSEDLNAFLENLIEAGF